MYTIDVYGELINDKGRTYAYADALRAVVSSESIVLDIGTGTGILAFLACRFGARKVYAIESDDIIQLARQVATANGLADRIEFIQATSTQVHLPEKVDVIVSDVRGVLPTFETCLLSIMDARDRFLKPTGRLIPQQETLSAALVCVPQVYREIIEAWESTRYGFDFQAMRENAVNNFKKIRINSDHLVSEPRCWARLDYRTLSAPNVCGQIQWTLDRSATAQGLAVWFDSELTDRVDFSNSPASPTRQIYGQGFFPWSRPVELSPGDEVSVQIRADLVGGDYVWCWNTEITATAHSLGKLGSFRQSTFQGARLSPQHLRKRAQTFIPTLTEDGRADHLILQQMADRVPLEDIARNVTAQFPHLFSTRQKALDRVGDLSTKYSL